MEVCSDIKFREEASCHNREMGTSCEMEGRENVGGSQQYLPLSGRRSQMTRAEYSSFGFKKSDIVGALFDEVRLIIFSDTKLVKQSSIADEVGVGRADRKVCFLGVPGCLRTSSTTVREMVRQPG